jgi:hypothetical protein
MSILDDAIREHLELKRAHGADAAELKRLEDEAFGPPGRPDQPDPLAEAPTEFLATERAGEEAEGEPSGRRVPNVADLQEAPPPKEPEPPSEPEPAAEEEQPAMEHELPDPAPDSAQQSHSTAERKSIAEQPTELFDVEGEVEAEASSPSDEELLDAEMSEPRLAPVEPADDSGSDEEDDDFFSEQRLSDELSQALDAPVEEEQSVEEKEEQDEEGEEDAYEEEEDDKGEPRPGPSDHEDVLEDTPDFLEDTPEDDDLWFEQRPPKDFDFDD